MPRIDAVLFDLDDTLITTRDAFVAGMSAIAQAYDLAVPDDGVTELARMWRHDPSGYYAEYMLGRLTLEEQRIARANEIHARFGGTLITPDTYPGWEAVFHPAFVGACLKHDDADAGLAAVAGFPIGIVSNAPRDFQLEKMANAGLDVPFLVGSDLLGVGKPDPRVFLEGCRLVGAAPEASVYVGDEFHTDAAAAVAAGLRAVWLDRPGHRREPLTNDEIAAAPFSRIESLTELADALAAID